MSANEVRVNTTTLYDQNRPVVAGLRNGSYVVVWTNSSGSSSETVRFQLYNSSGQAIGSEAQASSSTVYTHVTPSVTATSDGGFSVAWTSLQGDISVQRFSATGTKVGGELRANATTTNLQLRADIDGTLDGGTVATWTSYQNSSTSADIYFQRLTASGSRIGSELRVSTRPVQGYPSKVAALSDNSAIVTWVTTDPALAAGSNICLYGQRVSSTGSKIGSEFRISAGGGAFTNDVIALKNGGFVATWEGNDSSGFGIWARVYNASGTAVGAQFLVNSTQAGHQENPSITVLNNGDFLVSWESEETSGYRNIYSQRYTASGTRVGSNVRVNSYTASGNRTLTAVGATGTGYTVAWTSSSQDGSSDGVYATRFNSSGTAVATGTSTGVPTISTGATGGTTGTGGNRSPVILPLGDRVVREGSAFSISLPTGKISDPDGDSLTYVMASGTTTALPSWLSLDRSTGVLSGTAPRGTANVTIRLTAYDGKASTSSSFTLVTDTPPTLSALLVDRTVTEGRAFSVQLPESSFSDPENSLVWSLKQNSGAALPSWLTFDATTRTLSGTAPTGSADFNLRATVTDSAGSTMSDVFALRTATAPVDPGSTFPQAYSLGTASSTMVNFSNDLGSIGDYSDVFSFTLSRTSTVTATLDGMTGNATLYLMSPTASMLGTSTNSGTTPERISQTLAAGTYYLIASAYTTTNYALHLQAT